MHRLRGWSGRAGEEARGKGGAPGRGWRGGARGKGEGRRVGAGDQEGWEILEKEANRRGGATVRERERRTGDELAEVFTFLIRTVDQFS